MSANRPPYTPGFGLAPPTLAGRDPFIEWELESLRAGPGGSQFCVAFIGRRGVGKTALLDAIGLRVEAELGWPVMHSQALVGESLLATLVGRIPSALGPWRRTGRAFRRLEAELTLAVHLGVVSATATVRSIPDGLPASLADQFEALLRSVGTFGRDQGSGLLVTIDEAQNCSPADFAAIARGAQTVVARMALPVALVFAGLPRLRDCLAGGGTFAARMRTMDIEDLTAEQARLALVEPAGRSHVAWEPAALDRLVDASGGHPYYVQLFGYHAWLAAGGGDTLTDDLAQAGLVNARAQLEREHLGVWLGLRAAERELLLAVAQDRRGPAGWAPVQEVAARLGKAPKAVSRTRDRLVHVHCILEAPQRGQLCFASSEFAGWVATSAQEPGRLDAGRVAR